MTSCIFLTGFLFFFFLFFFDLILFWKLMLQMSCVNNSLFFNFFNFLFRAHIKLSFLFFYKSRPFFLFLIWPLHNGFPSFLNLNHIFFFEYLNLAYSSFTAALFYLLKTGAIIFYFFYSFLHHKRISLFLAIFKFFNPVSS